MRAHWRDAPRIACDADPALALVMNGPLSGSSQTAARNDPLLIVACVPSLFGLARPPHASTKSPSELCASRSPLGPFRRHKQHPSDNRHIIAGPHLDDEPCAKRGFVWPREKCERQMKIHGLYCRASFLRSEERRVGKECRSRWST